MNVICKYGFIIIQQRSWGVVDNFGLSYLFLHKNICCGYSLEAPQRGASIEYSQQMFAIKTYVVGTHWFLSTHNKCFYGELEKIILELSSNTPS